MAKRRLLNLAALLLITQASGAFAHGVIQDPPARNWFCGADTRPETALYGNPEYPVCTEAFSDEPEALNYEFMSVLSHSQGRSVVSPLPENVCGFDSEMFGYGRTPWDKPLDWPTSEMSPGRNKFTWNINWGAHFSDTEEFRYWITKPGFNFEVGKPLAWNDLESSPFCVLEYDDENPSANPDVVPIKATEQFDTYCSVPERSGRQVIYAEWGRNYYTYERFHGCVDVTFQAGRSAPPPTPAPEPVAMAAPAAEPAIVAATPPAVPQAAQTPESAPQEAPGTPAEVVSAESTEEATGDASEATTGEMAVPVEQQPAAAEQPQESAGNDDLEPPAAPGDAEVDDDTTTPTTEPTDGEAGEPATPPADDTAAPAPAVTPPGAQPPGTRVVARISTEPAGNTITGTGAINLSAMSSTGEGLSYRWSFDADNAGLYTLNSATSSDAVLMFTSPETAGTLSLSLNVTGPDGSDSTVLTLRHTPTASGTPDRVDLGALTDASRALEAGDGVSIRLVMNDGSDVFHPGRPMPITAENRDAALWPQALARAVNTATDSIVIGVPDANGRIDPAQSATANRIYADARQGIASAFLIVRSSDQAAADQPAAPASGEPAAPESAAPNAQPGGSADQPPAAETPDASPVAPQAQSSSATTGAQATAGSGTVTGTSVDTSTPPMADAAEATDESTPTVTLGTSSGSLDLGYLLMLALAVVWAQRRTRMIKRS